MTKVTQIRIRDNKGITLTLGFKDAKIEWGDNWVTIEGVTNLSEMGGGPENVRISLTTPRENVIYITEVEVEGEPPKL